MRNPGGHATIVHVGPAQRAKLNVRGSAAMDELVCEGVTEFDTYTCVHCSSIRHVPVAKKDTDYYFCRNCMGRICEKCADHPCMPFLKRIEEAEEADRRIRLIRGY